MLKSCEHFRDEYEPRSARAELESHRRECAECAAWADRLDALTALERRSLPGALRQRLLAIPERGISCQEVDRLYEATRRRALGEDADPKAVEHLESCARCRAVYGALAAAFRTRRRPLPRPLRRQLQKIADVPRLPLLARDGRLAVAASAILTASLLLLMGDPTTAFRQAAEEVSSRATVLAESGEEQRQAIWETFSEEIETRYENGRENLRDQGGVASDMWHAARDYYDNQKWRELFKSSDLEGESNG